MVAFDNQLSFLNVCSRHFFRNLKFKQMGIFFLCLKKLNLNRKSILFFGYDCAIVPFRH